MSIFKARGSLIQGELQMNRANDVHENYTKNQLDKLVFTPKTSSRG